MRVKLLAIAAACLTCVVGAPALAQGAQTQDAKPSRAPALAGLSASMAKRISADTARQVAQAAARPMTADAAGSPAADVAGPPADPVKVDMLEQIIVYLHCYDVIAYVGEVSALENAPSSFSADQKDNVRHLWETNILARRKSIIHNLAVSNSVSFTTAQLTTMLALSKIRYLQDAALEGANPAWAADERTLTAADNALVDQHPDAEATLGAFFNNLSIDAIKPDLAAAAVATMQGLTVAP